MAFDSSNEAWRHAILNGTGGQQLPFCLNLNVLPPKEQHSEEHRRFLMTFEEKWRTNRPIMLILHAIALFTVPNGILLMSKEMIEESKQKYCALLKRQAAEDKWTKTRILKVFMDGKQQKGQY